MFIRSALDTKIQDKRRIAVTLSPLGKEIREKQQTKYHGWKIGSVKFERVNYEMDEHFFSAEDIPKPKLEAYRSMKDFTDPDVLGLKKKGWNAGTLVSKYPAQEETFDRKLMRIRMGLLDQPIQKPYNPKIAEGCDARDEYTGWSVSTELPGIYQTKMKLEEDTKQCLDKTRQFFDKRQKNNMSKTDYIGKYKNPEESTKELNEKLRKIKEEDAPLREELRKKYTFEHPETSKENVDAGVFRMVFEHKVKGIKPHSEFEAMNLTFEPDIAKTLRNEKYFKWFHNGTWGKNAISKDKEVWSCCMCEEKTAKGCNKIQVDPKKWNLTSYC